MCQQMTIKHHLLVQSSECTWLSLDERGSPYDCITHAEEDAYDCGPFLFPPKNAPLSVSVLLKRASEMHTSVLGTSVFALWNFRGFPQGAGKHRSATANLGATRGGRSYCASKRAKVPSLFNVFFRSG